jgi:hypothetical protein
VRDLPEYVPFVDDLLIRDTVEHEAEHKLHRSDCSWAKFRALGDRVVSVWGASYHNATAEELASHARCSYC